LYIEQGILKFKSFMLCLVEEMKKSEFEVKVCRKYVCLD